MLTQLDHAILTVTAMILLIGGTLSAIFLVPAGVAQIDQRILFGLYAAALFGGLAFVLLHYRIACIWSGILRRAADKQKKQAATR
jgi:hypothetical protein